MKVKDISVHLPYKPSLKYHPDVKISLYYGHIFIDRMSSFTLHFNPVMRPPHHYDQFSSDPGVGLVIEILLCILCSQS